MAAANELAATDAVGQAALVRSGEVSATELVEAAIERIERLNPELNAVIMTRYAEARDEALAPVDGPLSGVPFLLKDIGATQSGTPNHLGNQALKNAGVMSSGDTVLGARFRDAGLITLGKTNLPELGTVPVTQSPAYGAARNPWDPTRSTSGSSGGAAAAVASGMVPVAHANDGGGSTRLPAGWNGLVGLKTTRGRQPMPTSGSRLTSELVVTRTVRDTAAVLDATHGHTSGDLYHLAPPSRPFSDEVDVDAITGEVSGLRVGLLVDGGVEYEIDPECVAAAEAGAAMLESWGCAITPVTGDVLFGGDGRVNGQLWMAGIRHRVNLLGETIGRPLTEDEVDPYNWASAQRANDLTAADLFSAQDIQQQWSADACEWLDQFDVLITPTAGCRPLLLEDGQPDPEAPWRIGRTYGLVGRFTLPFNVTGHPGISLPLHSTPEGLPVGTQFVAGMGREDLLLRLAARAEADRPWSNRRPLVWAG
ncbi:MAG: amidase [Candidatus Poriferisodalaceae bacterium]|jgi:amidase